MEPCPKKKFAQTGANQTGNQTGVNRTSIISCRYCCWRISFVLLMGSWCKGRNGHAIGGAQQAQTGDQALWQSSGQAWTRQSGRPGNLASKLEPGNRAGLAIWQTWQSSHQSNLSHQDLNGVSETGPQWSFWDRTWMILSGVPQACWAPESAIY